MFPSAGIHADVGPWNAEFVSFLWIYCHFYEFVWLTESPWRYRMSNIMNNDGVSGGGSGNSGGGGNSDGGTGGLEGLLHV